MKNLIKKIWAFIWKTILAVFALSIFLVILFRFVPVPITPLMLIRVAEQLEKRKPVKIEKKWKSLEEISPRIVLAVIASEDNKFLRHFGFDIDAIKKAMNDNARKKGKLKKGGSTITQQTAKNVFLWPGRSWLRKGCEAYFTLLIETFWSKKRILEVYLNVIEMGDGIYGAEAAARTFFKKPAKNLSSGEAALIAAVLPNPRKWSPAKPTSYIYSRQRWILWNMRNINRVAFE